MSTSTVDSFSVSKADNGFTFNYTIKTKKSLSSNTYDNCSYDSKSLVFEESNVEGLKEEIGELIDSMVKGKIGDNYTEKKKEG